MRRPTARVRRHPFFRTLAKLARQYLKWYGNASYKPHQNGERWVLDRLRHELPRTVVDVGANVGSWALMAAERLPDATVYALEIVPATFARLRERVSGQPRIRPFNLGLAEREGRLRVRYDPRASAHATFTEYPHGWTGDVVECPVTAGDAFLRAQGLGRVDFLKIDVEGAEHLVLRGFADALGSGHVRFVQFEYGRVNVLTKFLLRDFYELFRSYGFVVGKIFPDFVDFRPYELGDEDFLGPNYLACRADDPALGRLSGAL
ncbi:MAG: FkbM family methyltransferase [Gemmatimonadales bacterium]